MSGERTLREAPTSFLQGALGANPAAPEFSWGSTRAEVETELQRRYDLGEPDPRVKLPPTVNELGRHWAAWLAHNGLSGFLGKASISRRQTPFIEKVIHHRHLLRLPFFLASKDIFEYWERERTESMALNLVKGDVLFDIGAEEGWQSAIYAKFVGPENVCLFEPSALVWPNIRATWEESLMPFPRSGQQVLVSDRTTTTVSHERWPKCATGDLRITRNAVLGQDAMAYEHLGFKGEAENTQVGELKIDDFCAALGVYPRALTIDVEGAELQVLRGALVTLVTHRPLVWVSLHPVSSRKYFGYDIDDVNRFMASVGYAEKWLATDHEEHWLFYPTEQAVKDIPEDVKLHLSERDYWRTHEV